MRDKAYKMYPKPLYNHVMYAYNITAHRHLLTYFQWLFKKFYTRPDPPSKVFDYKSLTKGTTAWSL